MALSEQLQRDLTAAMKARDRQTVGALRMVVAALRHARVAAGQSGELTDEQTEALVAREAKKRTEAAEAYERAGRDELAEQERRELEVIRRYLPEQLHDESLAAIVDEAVAATGASSRADMGKVMGAVMPQVQGRADGKRVSALVRARLQP